MSTSAVGEQELLTMLAKRSGIAEEDFFVPMYESRRRRNDWPIPRADAEALLGEMLAALQAVLPAPKAPGAKPAARYVWLSEIIGAYERCDTRRLLERIRQAGVTPAVREPGAGYDPLEEPSWDEFPEAREWSWWQEVRHAEVRPYFRMPDPWVGRGEPPVDRALAVREATGDGLRYEQMLLRALDDDPRHVDCWAHLGSLNLDRASRGGRTSKTWLREALGCYEAGVAVAELSLPAGFNGVLAWGQLDNRPFHRALHGLGLALWRLGEYEAAATVQLNSLKTNPDDNQGIRFLIGQVQSGTAWRNARD